MIYVWIQSVVILGLAFSGGLWLGGSLSRLAERTARAPAPVLVLSDGAALPFRNGADVAAEPAVYHPPSEASPAIAAAPPPVAEPVPALSEPASETRPVPRWVMLYPPNQFGTLSVTRMPASV